MEGEKRARDESTMRRVSPIIDLRGICKSYGSTRVLDGVSLTVDAGKIVVVIGSSGAGKSTLLRCINLLERPSAGQIKVEGAVAFDAGRKIPSRDLVRIRRRLGFVFQEFHLFSHLTAVENVQLGLTDGLAVPKAEALERSLRALDVVGLGGRPLAYPDELSGGQRQRVGIARALALQPAAMLMDEPTSALDPELAGGVLDVMRALAAAGMTMVISTHELDFAREVADEIVFIDAGRVVESGAPSEVLNRPSQERTQEFLSRYHDTVLRRTRV